MIYSQDHTVTLVRDVEKRSDEAMTHLNESEPNQNRIANTLFCYEKSGRSKSRVEEAGNLRRAGARRN